MDLFYTILFINLNAATGERVAVGLVLIDRTHIYYKLSFAKLQAIKNILGRDGFQLVQDGLKTFSDKIRRENELLQKQLKNGFWLFVPEEASADFQSGYISYLSRYKNNIITYSPPVAIDIKPSEEMLERIFQKLILEVSVDASPAGLGSTKPIDRLVQQYQSEIGHHFIQDKTIEFDEVENLMIPVKVNLAGKNERDVFVQSISMDGKPAQIIQEISTFYLLKDTYKQNGVAMKDFVLTSEPPKTRKRQHELWQHLYESKQFDYVDVSEAERIIIYAREHNVKPHFGNDLDSLF